MDEILVTASYGGLNFYQVRYFRLTLQESELLRNKKQESKGTLPCHILNVALGTIGDYKNQGDVRRK